MTDEALFSAAIAFADATARAAFLDRECTDPAQRTRLERLLAAYRDDSFLEPAALTRVEAVPTVSYDPGQTASLNPDATTATADPDRTSDARSHSSVAGIPTVPGHEILGVLGEGGMGVVYKALQTAVNRVVAVKMIRSGLGSPAERSRFRSEAEAAARLTHPGVVRVYEFGEASGLPYFTLEYCDGGSLADKLDGTPWHATAAARLTEMLTDAVAAAHQQGIVHRDLKPANVLLARMAGPDGGTVTDPHAKPLLYAALRAPHGAVPKVTDFGISKRIDSPDGPTATGAIMGTPSYMAPEQASGESKSVGPAADVYALGAMLYQLLTGRPPFKAATVMETMDQVRKQEPVAVRALNPACPRDMETICLKCLQKEPGKRYATAVELANDLRRFQEGRPIAARPVGSAERSWRWCRRNPAVASLMVAVALVLLGGISATSWGLVRALDAEADTRTALNRITDEEEKVRGERDAKQTALAAEEEARKNLEVQLASRQVDDVIEIHEKAGGDDFVHHFVRLLSELPRNAVALRDYLQLRTLIQGSARHEQLSRLLKTDPVSLFSNSSSEVIRYQLDGSISICDPLTAQPRVTMKIPDVELKYVTHSDNNRVLVAKREIQPRQSGMRKTVYYFFDMNNGKMLSELPPEQRDDAQISPDGRRYLSYRHSALAARPSASPIELWNTTTGKLVGAWNGYNSLANCSPDSRWIVAYGGKEKNKPAEPVRVYSTDDGRLAKEIPAGADGYLYATVTPSGKYLVTFTCKEIQWYRTSDWIAEGKPCRSFKSDLQVPSRFISDEPGVARVENSSERRRIAFDDYALVVGAETKGSMIIGGSVELHLRGREDPIEHHSGPGLVDSAHLVLENGQLIQFNPYRVSSPQRGRRYAPQVRGLTADGRFLNANQDGCSTAIDFAAEKNLVTRVVSATIRGRKYAVFNRDIGSGTSSGLLGEIGAITNPRLIPLLPGGYDQDLLALWCQIVWCGEMDERNVFQDWDEPTWQAKREELARRIEGRPEAEVMQAAATNRIYWIKNRVLKATTSAELFPLFDRMIRDDPQQRHYLGRANLYHRVGKLQEAAQDWRAAMRLGRIAPQDSQYFAFMLLKDLPENERDLFMDILLTPGMPKDLYEMVLQIADDPKLIDLCPILKGSDWRDLIRYRMGKYRELANSLYGIQASRIQQVAAQLALGCHSPLASAMTLRVFSTPNSINPSGWTIPSQVMLAMCEFQLGNKESAKTRLTQQLKYEIPKHLPDLRDEAKTLISKPDPAPK